MKDCKFLLDGKKFNSEEELENYIQNNYDLDSIGDYRFSKNLAEDAVKILSNVNKRNQEALHDIKNKYYSSTEDEVETYKDGYTAASEFVNDNLVRKSERYNDEKYFNTLREKFRNDLASSFPNIEEREKEVERLINEERQRMDDIRRAGKGLHNFCENLFYPDVHRISNKYITDRRTYLKNNYPEASLDKISDSVLSDLGSQIIRAKNKLSKGKKILKTFTEPCIDYVGNAAKIRGKIDAVIIYEDGSIDVLDFKISETPWGAADINKRDAAEKQLHLYRTILEANGIKGSNINLYVFPITLTRQGDKYTNAIVGESTLEPLSYSPEYTSKIYEVLDIHPDTQPINSELAKTTIGIQGKMFGFDTCVYEKDKLNFDFAWDILVGPPKGDTYSFRSQSTGELHSSKSRSFIENDLIADLNLSKTTRQIRASEIKDRINNMKEKSNQSLTFLSGGRRNIEMNEWLNREFYKYKVNEGWRAIDNPDLLQLGVIMFQNDITREIDFVSITFDNLFAEAKLKYGTTLLGNFKSDKEVIGNKNRLRASLGNMELMKLMHIANQLQSNYTIGELKVVSLLDRSEMRSTGIRDKLVYNYNVLAHEIGFEPNKFEFTDIYYQILEEGRNIRSEKYDRSFYDIPNSRDVRATVLKEDAKSKSEQLSQLVSLWETIANIFYKGDKTAKDDYTMIGRYFNDIQQAISDLSGITIDFNNANQLKESIIGGGIVESYRTQKTFNSTLFNTQDTIPIVKAIYNKIEDAGLKLKNRYYTYKTLDRQHTDKFKQSANSLYANNVVNRYEVAYRNLFDTSERGKTKFLLKDYRTDTSLNASERAYLKWWLESVNKIRFPGMTIDQLAENNIDEERWFEVPLLRAGITSQIVNNKKSVGKAIKDQYGFEDPVLSPKMALGMVFTQTDFGKNQLIFDKMYNVFACSEDETMRTKMLQEMGVDTFETNLERIKDMYHFSQIRKEIYDPVLSEISAALGAYAFNANMSNTYKANEDTINYITQFIQSSVLDESLIDEDYEDEMRIVSSLKSTASRMVLGCNILSMAKEGIVGWWTLYNNALANHWDPTRFGIKEATKAYFMVWKDSVNQIKTITLGEHLNFQYGISNMSMQEMVERENFYQGQVGRWDDRLFWTSRACDYLHRMTIFYAYMIKDGSLDAHEIKDGHVEYDWTKDKRFSIYAKYDNEEEVPTQYKEVWKEQRSLFEAMRNQMVEDGVEYVVDWTTGETRTLQYTDKFLPRAFTNNEARKIIQEANTMYGYMDTANKSLWFKKGIGVLIGQFQTYFSAKKNQYFLTPDVYQNGHWVLAKDEQGRQLYRDYDAKGNPTITLEDNGNPIKVWEGSMMGGIFWSLKSMFNVFTAEGRAGMKAAWTDPNNRRNFSLFLGDISGLLFFLLLSWMLYGGMTKSELSYWDRNIQKVINNASNEFNPYKVFTGQLEFKFTSFEIVYGFMKDIFNALTGNMNIFKALSSNIGVLRPYRDLIYDSISE